MLRTLLRVSLLSTIPAIVGRFVPRSPPAYLPVSSEDECPSFGVLRKRCDYRPGPGYRPGFSRCKSLFKCANRQDDEIIPPEDIQFPGSREHREATAEELQLFEEGVRGGNSVPGTHGRRCTYGQIDVGALRRDSKDCVAGLDGYCGVFEFLCTCAPPELAREAQKTVVRRYSNTAAAVFLFLGLLGFLLAGMSSLVLCLSKESYSRATAASCTWFLRIVGLASLLGMSLAVLVLSVAAWDPEEHWGEWPYLFYAGCDKHISGGLTSGGALVLLYFTTPAGAILGVGLVIDYLLQRRGASAPNQPAAAASQRTGGPQGGRSLL